MKKKSTKIFLWLLFTLCSTITFSQTVINYETWAGSSDCNIFASSTNVPATVNGTPGSVAHRTAIGQPTYDNSNKSVNLTAQISSSTNQGTEYQIAYNFKAGSSYKIIVNARFMSVPTGPNVLLRLDLNSGGSGNNTQCNGPGTIDASGSGGLKRSQQIGSTTFSNYEFTWPALSTVPSFLMVAAIPPAGSISQTVLIRKITIEETTNVPTPSFSISPGQTSITCGNTDPVTFTINNNNNTPGITDYTWNLGATPNNWLINGNPAPATFSTGTTNTITLTPVCGASPSGVTATITANGNTYQTSNTASVSITAPNMSINGSAAFCTGSSTYSINNLPCNASVTWSVSPDGIASLSCTSCPTTTLTKVADGRVTLTATISNVCGSAPITISIPVSIGVPDRPMVIDENGEEVTTYTACTDVHIEICPHVNGVVDEWKWEKGVGNFNMSTGACASIIGFQPGSGFVTVQVRNSCGWSNLSFYVIRIEDCMAADSEQKPVDPKSTNQKSITLYPNPASGSVTISVDRQKNALSKTNAAAIQISEVKIYDSQGRLQLSRKYNKQQTARLEVSNLKNGIYIVEINTGNGLEYQQLVIQK